MREDENTNTITGVQKDNLVVTERIAGWHENENVIAAHMGDDKRSTVQEHVYHKETGQLTAMGTAHVPNVILAERTQIRRLTEIEVERLQGFPDNHTQYGNYDGVIKKIPKTQRYKLMGNAVMVDMVKAVAGRIKLINDK